MDLYVFWNLFPFIVVFFILLFALMYAFIKWLNRH